MFADWMWTSWEEAGLIALSAVAMVATIIAAIRVIGLRSFSKMSSFDFAVTVAIGSVMASTVATSTSYANGAIAVWALLGVQFVIAKGRRRFAMSEIVDNTPRFLMRDGVMIESALASTRVTEDDVLAKLREANVLAFAEVRAVVLETTGDISVLHGDREIDEGLVAGVLGTAP